MRLSGYVHQELVAEIREGMSEPAGDVPTTFEEIPGWFATTDQDLFAWFLADGPPGDLVELGVFQGKSAVHMGRFRRPGERFTVCDLFEGAGSDESILPSARVFYATLTQRVFERNYLLFHDELPHVVRDATAAIHDHVEPGSCRFVHVDASHQYEHVRGDLLAARAMCREDGVVAFDDYRTEHTPGTAAAVWEGVVRHGLRPICVSPDKFYGTWGDPGPVQERLLSWAADHPDYLMDVQSVLGHRLLRLVRRA